MKKFAIAAALTAILATTAGVQAQSFRGSYDNHHIITRNMHNRRDFERHERERRIREARERERMRHHHDFFAGNHYSRYR